MKTFGKLWPRPARPFPLYKRDLFPWNFPKSKAQAKSKEHPEHQFYEFALDERISDDENARLFWGSRPSLDHPVCCVELCRAQRANASALEHIGDAACSLGRFSYESVLLDCCDGQQHSLGGDPDVRCRPIRLETLR